MDKIAGKYYIVDNMIFESSDLINQFDNSPYQLYEVIRTINGVLLFLEDHIERLQEALKKINLYRYYNEPDLRRCLFQLLQANKIIEGNIKLLCKESGARLIYAAYYIPHSYPDKTLYKYGIKLKSYIIERTNPNLKQIKVNELIKSKINTLLSSGEFYEVLLVNAKGNITEGSKSNFFLIKENTVYSAPENLILKGVTRKYIVKIIKDLQLNYIEKEVSIKELPFFDAAFITGTSPKVLPVIMVDQVSYSPVNGHLLEIIQNYDYLFNNYILNNKDQLIN